MNTLAPVITSAGLAALVATNNQGLQAQISHVAFGDGGTDAGVGYTPQAGQGGLVRERARVAVGGGQRVAPAEIEVSALLDTGPSFWMREVGFVLSTGTFLAVWSDPAVPLGYKTAGVPLAVAYYLALEAVPANSVNVLVTGPSVNLTMAGPIATMAAGIVELQRRVLQIDVDRYTADPINKLAATAT